MNPTQPTTLKAAILAETDAAPADAMRAAIRYDVAQCARIAALYQDLVRAG